MITLNLLATDLLQLAIIVSSKGSSRLAVIYLILGWLSNLLLTPKASKEKYSCWYVPPLKAFILTPFLTFSGGIPSVLGTNAKLPIYLLNISTPVLHLLIVEG